VASKLSPNTTPVKGIPNHFRQASHSEIFLKKNAFPTASNVTAGKATDMDLIRFDSGF
jgi:hypothetical protein